MSAIVLFLNLPIPLYWFAVHPLAKFWRKRAKAAYAVGLLCSWLPMTIFLIAARRELFRAAWPAWWALWSGMGLIAFEVWLFWRVRLQLGIERLVGKTELSGGGEIARSGIYARIRHPRYAGSFLAIVGACLLSGTTFAWLVAAVWTAAMRFAILLEEREMRARFGPAFEEYRRSVPKFLPLRRRG